MGDPAGVGPEITQKAWQALRGQRETAFFVIGDPRFYRSVRAIEHPCEAAHVFANALPILPLECASIEHGEPNEKAAPAIIKSIEQAVAFAIENTAAAIVTNPIAKDVLYRAGFKHPGHTEFLNSLTEGSVAPYTRGPMMMLSAKDLRVALVTIHSPLKDIADAITKDKIVKAATLLDESLRIDFGIKSPRLAMAGLNPHAGENGSIGMEEIDILNPAAEYLRTRGINITDAQSADTLFHEEARANYDAALCMYHDQGLIPVKTLDFHGGVNTTLGLPIVRTSPDHGTAFDIAGKGIARPDSLIAAIHMARQISHQRSMPR
ncbi:MAG: 4-hydroxythreonine-4-phosphate dehydrogenase PdxA [Acidimicrobiales bacterium]|nr:4-hydroxythreonine-4-phosphate dehydrogenase PdxA [Hyphomonadaceae bacterium]RZV41989.1 MAG: 4-hydroxythreonine-4-phosphate dehydrogenase PdxA [Acidimicrobiales bacterium]